MRRTRFAAAIAACVLLSACGSSTGATGDKGYINGDGSTVLVAQPKRGEPIALSGTSLEGKSVDIAAWRGDVVVVNMWASWCGPCRNEAVTLAKVSDQLRGAKVHFLGLNTRDGLAAARAFAARFPTGYPSIQDGDGRLTLVFGNLGPAATPTTIVLDRKGRVAARMLGAVTEAQLRDVALAVVGEQ